MHTEIIPGDDGYFHYNVIDACGGVCECKNISRDACEKQITKQQDRARENGEVVQFNNAETSRTIKPGLKQERERRVLELLATQDATITELKLGTRIGQPTIDRLVDGLIVRGLIKKMIRTPRGRGRSRVMYRLHGGSR